MAHWGAVAGWLVRRIVLICRDRTWSMVVVCCCVLLVGRVVRKNNPCPLPCYIP